MAKKLLFLFAVLSLFCAQAMAQASIVPLIKELPQRIAYNPALEVTNNAYFVLPALGGISASAENSGFNFGDVFARGADDSLHFDLNHLADNMRRRSLTSANVVVPILSVGVRVGREKRNYLSFDITNHTTADVVMPRSVLDFRYGNFNYDAKLPVNTSVSEIFVRAMNYTELAIGFSRDLTPNFRAGVRLKALAGSFSLQSDDVAIRVETIRDEEMRSRLEIETSGAVKVSAPLDVELGDDGFVDSFDLGDWSDIDFSRNKGFAVDLGATLRLWDNLVLGASLVDVGFISWTGCPHLFQTNESFTFRGLNEDEQIKGSTRDESKSDYFDQLADSLDKFRDVSYCAKSFRTPLSGHLLLSGEWQMAKWLTVGGLARFRAVGGQIFSTGSASAQFHVGNCLTGVFSATLEHGARPSLGTGLVLSAGAFQFYFLSDRIPLKLINATGVSFSTGINFVIGHRHFERWGERGAED